jgi:hypothetical protein
MVALAGIMPCACHTKALAGAIVLFASQHKGLQGTGVDGNPFDALSKYTIHKYLLIKLLDIFSLHYCKKKLPILFKNKIYYDK